MPATSSFTTLVVSGNYFLRSDIPTDMLPDWSRMDELLISAIIGALIALLNGLVLFLENGNGSDGPKLPHPDQPKVEPTPFQLPEGK